MRPSHKLGLLPPANGQQLLQRKVGLLPGNGQELALKDLKNSKGRSPPTPPEVQWTSGDWTSGGVGGLRPRPALSVAL